MVETVAASHTAAHKLALSGPTLWGLLLLLYEPGLRGGDDGQRFVSEPAGTDHLALPFVSALFGFYLAANELARASDWRANEKCKRVGQAKELGCRKPREGADTRSLCNRMMAGCNVSV